MDNDDAINMAKDWLMDGRLKSALDAYHCPPQVRDNLFSWAQKGSPAPAFRRY